MEVIDKSALIAKIKEIEAQNPHIQHGDMMLNRDRSTRCRLLEDLLEFIDTLKVIDPYKEYIQYDSIKAGIQAHAETYSFNIESKLFNQLSKEQQELWRKEIEQACISGGEVGVELAKDPRYKEEELIKFLKNNLKIELDINDSWETKDLCVRLCLGDEIISNEFISI